MVTIPTSARKTTYNPVASAGPFNVGFPIFDSTGADIVVTLAGVIKVVTTDWTIAPGTAEEGFFGAPTTWSSATIAFLAPITGELIIKGKRAPRRVAQYVEGQGVPARDQNADSNIHTAVTQELRRDVDDIDDASTALSERIDDVEADFAAGQAAQDAAVAAQFAALNEQIQEGIDAAEEAVEARDDVREKWIGEYDFFPEAVDTGFALVDGAAVSIVDQPDPDDDGIYVRRDGLWQPIGVQPEAFSRDWRAVVTVDGQTVVPVPGGYVPGQIEVWFNGAHVELGPSPAIGDPTKPAATASDGVNIVFPAGFLLAGDLLEGDCTRPALLGAAVAAETTFTPPVGMTAIQVQSALEELNTRELLKAPLASPALTGNPTAPTQLTADSSTRLATTALVDAKIAAIPPAASVPLPPGYLSGFGAANDVTDPTNDMVIAAGSARDSTDALNIILAAALTKRLDAVWAVGTNQGGLDTGAKANNTWYYLHAICKADGTGVDVLFSLSATAPTLPATYTKFRRISSVLTDGAGAIRPRTQFGDLFVWGTPRLDLNAAIGVTHTALTLSVPPIAGIIAEIQGFAQHASLTPSVSIYRIGDVVDFNAPTVRVIGTAYTGYFARVVVNGSGQVNHVSQQNTTNLSVGTVSYIDRRGRDA